MSCSGRKEVESWNWDTLLMDGRRSIAVILWPGILIAIFSKLYLGFGRCSFFLDFTWHCSTVVAGLVTLKLVSNTGWKWTLKVFSGLTATWGCQIFHFCPCETRKRSLIPKIVSVTGKMTNEWSKVIFYSIKICLKSCLFGYTLLNLNVYYQVFWFSRIIKKKTSESICLSSCPIVKCLLRVSLVRNLRGMAVLTLHSCIFVRLQKKYIVNRRI